MVNLISLTFTVPNFEVMDVPDVVIFINIEEMATVDIMAQQETTIDEDGISNGFKVTRNLWGSIAKNVSKFLSHPSYHVDQTLPNSQGQFGHL